MDWRTFVVEFVGKVAWPVTIIVAAYIFRNPLIQLIPLIRSLRIRDIEMTFGETLAEAREDATELAVSRDEEELAVSRDEGEKESAKFEPIKQLARSHPPAAIIESWKLIEDELRQCAKRIGMADMAGNPSQLFLELKNDGSIGPYAGRLFDRLRTLRNSAAHESGFTVSEGQALEYVDLAESMALFINSFPHSINRKRKKRGQTK